jgi:hypothetical protein
MGSTSGARLTQILDLFVEDDRLNVYAGELEVRPPGAPTTGPATRGDSDSTRRRQPPSLQPAVNGVNRQARVPLYRQRPMT